MGDYYDVAIVPTLVRSPKGKPSVEGTVGKVTSSIIARLRKEEFNSVIEANVKIKNVLKNSMQSHSRREMEAVKKSLKMKRRCS